MSKKIVSVIIRIMIIGLGIFGYSVVTSDAKDLSGIYKGFLDVVTTIDGEIRDNSVWCGPLQIARQDLVNDINTNSQSKSNNSWNKEIFSSDEMSENDYYNKGGLLTFDLQSEITQGVRSKFNESIDPQSFTFEGSIIPQSSDYYEKQKEKKYLIYSKFKKIINLRDTFDILDNGNFADVYDDIRYFGINCNSSKKYDQVKILYYNTDSDFAVSITSQGGEEIIFVRGTKGKSFLDTYNKILIKERKFQESQDITRYDCLKIPEFNLKFEKEIFRLRNEKLSSFEGEVHKIGKAIQGIEMRFVNLSSIQRNGNKVNKSTQLTDVVGTKYRYLYFDEPFTIFVREYGKELPYFAAQVSDIKLFQ